MSKRHPAKKEIMKLFGAGRKGIFRGNRKTALVETVTDSCLRVQSVEGRNEGTGHEPCGRHDVKMMTIGHKSSFYNPIETLRDKLRDALDPDKVPGKARTLADMTDEEKERL